MNCHVRRYCGCHFYNLSTLSLIGLDFLFYVSESYFYVFPFIHRSETSFNLSSPLHHNHCTPLIFLAGLLKWNPVLWLNLILAFTSAAAAPPPLLTSFMPSTRHPSSHLMYCFCVSLNRSCRLLCSLLAKGETGESARLCLPDDNAKLGAAVCYGWAAQGRVPGRHRGRRERD